MRQVLERRDLDIAGTAGPAESPEGVAADPWRKGPDPREQLSGRAGIAEVAQAFGMTPRAIRFYESRGLISCGRDRMNVRVFDAMAHERLRRIGLLRSAGLSVKDVAELITAEPGGDLVLEKLRARRHALEAMLQRVDEVIAEYGASRGAA